MHVHGGLTYADKRAPQEDDLQTEVRMASSWWFGFDCAHYNDLVPGLRKYRYDGVYRDFLYVKDEAKSLAKQLAAAQAECE